MFLDVKGAFDHISANQLLSICKELGLPIAFTQWVATFISNWKIQLSFNGQTQEKIKIKTGIPQGSPISLILFMLYLYNICRLKTEGAYTLSYANDFAITVTLNSAKINCKKLKGIVLKLMSKAKEAVISFNISKIKLIHFYNKRTTIKKD